MNKFIINKQHEETFETISNRMFNIKHCLNLFIYNLQNGEFNENPVEIICLGLLLKEYFNQTKKIYNELEEELGIAV